MKKISEEEVRNYLFNNGGWKLLSKYTGTHNDIIIERNGYKCKTCFTSFRKNNNAIIFGVRNPFYKENIKILIERIDKNVLFIDARGVNKGGKYRLVVDMIDANGHKFSKTIEHILNEKEGLCCKLCARKEQTKRHREKFTTEWLNRIDNSKYKVLKSPDYITADSILEVEEISTGYRFTSNIRSLVKYSIQPFNVYVNKTFFLYNLKIYGEKYGLYSTPIKISDTDLSHTKVLFKCKCGKEFERSIYKWMDGRDVCKSCSQLQSSYERMFESYLIENKIKYIPEYRFNNCRDIKPLPFDFYLPEFDCLIEIDGEQHFRPVKFGNDKDAPDKRFNLQQKHDKIKEDYCKSNKIALLRIPYICFNDGTWEQVFNHFIKTVKE